ncbi:conserved protein of unknown function [Ralstonia solanacearum CMR15]|nr:conserved protein of unknown function [Ralstonia solanacearum CMR15]
MVMLRVTIELLPGGRDVGRKVLATANIRQEKGGALADYCVDLHDEFLGNVGVGAVREYPRFATSVFDLVVRALAVGLAGEEELPARPQQVDVPVRRAGDVEYVRLWEIPEPAQSIFRKHVARLPALVIETESRPKDCVYASIWCRFLSGR